MYMGGSGGKCIVSLPSQFVFFFSLRGSEEGEVEVWLAGWKVEGGRCDGVDCGRGGGEGGRYDGVGCGRIVGGWC